MNELTQTELRLDGRAARRLHEHLFQPDQDEHAAVALAGVSVAGDRLALTARELELIDARDFGPGAFGYRQTSPRLIAELSTIASDEGLAYVALHSHPSATTSVGLSADDRRGHERLFPHLLRIVGNPVAGLALGKHVAAGEIWLPDGQVLELDVLKIVGSTLELHRPSTPQPPLDPDDRFDRQIKMFGAEGQAILAGSHVAVIGCGGGGSLLVEQLAHLGVGRLTLVDFDVVKSVNLSRIVGATSDDAARATKKVDVAKRLVESIDPTIECEAVDGDIADADVAERLLRTDFIFLATDTATSRLVVNSIVHRFFIPAVQIGAKVEIAGSSGTQIYAAVRPVLPDHGCLDCANLIDPIRLQEEARSEEERVAQNYLGLPEIIDPAVITLNAIGAAHAMTLMLLWLTGLVEPDALRHTLFFPVDGDQVVVNPTKRDDCLFCSLDERSAYGRGGSVNDLPVRRRHSPADASLEDQSGVGWASRVASLFRLPRLVSHRRARGRR